MKWDSIDNWKQGAVMRKQIPVLALAIALALAGCGKVEHDSAPAKDNASADTGGSETQRLCRKIHPLPDSSGFEMNVAVTAIAIDIRRALQVPNHRERGAGITGEVLT